MTWSWDIAGDCHEPVTRELHARPSPAHRTPLIPGGAKYSLDETFNGVGEDDDIAARTRAPERKKTAKYITVKRGSETPLRLILEVRCRRCDKCRRLRRMLWTNRAKHEVERSVRTWFGTLTLRPEVAAFHRARAQARCSRSGTDFDALPYWEQFVRLHNEAGREITLMLKRIRKLSGAKFRFLLVAEAHKSGLPHYHILLHEQDPATPIRKALLDAQWRSGFCQWRLVQDIAQATYLCKYLAKSTAARVRASVRYGMDAEETLLQHSSKNVTGIASRSERRARQDIPPGASRELRVGDPAHREGSIENRSVENGYSVSATKPEGAARLSTAAPRDADAKREATAFAIAAARERRWNEDGR